MADEAKRLDLERQRDLLALLRKRHSWWASEAQNLDINEIHMAVAEALAQAEKDIELLLRLETDTQE